MALFGAIEAGGTKFVCAVGTGPEDLRARMVFPTSTPGETIRQVVEFLGEAARHEPLAAVGIASFGPVDVKPDSPRFGYITSTPKAGWQNVDLAGEIRRTLDLPVAFDTDVNAAALGEAQWGAAQSFSDFLYLTIGTGIGGGAVVNGQVLRGLLHPEMGHIRIPHDFNRDPYLGCCPFHGDCLEGLASGPAMQQRWGMPPEDLPANHAAWALEAHYLALGLANWVCTLSPRCILLGGGVMRQEWLFEMIREDLGRLLNGYVRAKELTENLKQYVIPPKLGNRSGIVGALVLAEQAYQKQQELGSP